MNPCPAACPICGGDNSCHFAAPSGYKGDCWCAREEVPAALLERMPEEARNVACVCRRCIVAAQVIEARARPLPRPAAGDFYLEGGKVVFTAQFHRRRGYCCGSGCRHCPFDALQRAVVAER
jgi:hypothetical protein